MTKGYENMSVRDIAGNPIRRWEEGDRIIGLKGNRSGQTGKLVEPLGVNVSWVKWDKGMKGPAYSVYSFENMKPVEEIPISVLKTRKRGFGPFND